MWSGFSIFLFYAFFSPFLFRSFSWCGPFFSFNFNGFVCWLFMWVILVVTCTARTTIIVFLLSLYCAVFYLSEHFRSFGGFENETKEETEKRTLISLEKLKSEIYLQDLHLKKYEIQLSNLDANMITYFTANYENNICDNLIELCERETDDSKKDWKGRNRQQSTEKEEEQWLWLSQYK